MEFKIPTDIWITFLRGKKFEFDHDQQYSCKEKRNSPTMHW